MQTNQKTNRGEVKYTVTSFGRVYRSAGATTGPTGTISGLTRDNVLSHIAHAANRPLGESYLKIVDNEGRQYPQHKFRELTETTPDAPRYYRNDADENQLL